MRHIILGLSLLIALPQPAQADDSNNFLYCLVIFGVIGLVDGVYKLSAEQKRKNDLLEDTIRQKKAVSKTLDPIVYFKTLEQTAKTHTETLERLVALTNNNPSLQQHYRGMLQKSIEVQKEASDSLAWAQQLTAEKREQFGLILQENLTAKDIKLLVALKKRDYHDIPQRIIDETKNNEYISLPGEPNIRISKKLLEKLEQQSARTV